MNSDDDDRGLSRRTMLRAAAWAAPIIVLTTAAPAAAASGEVLQVRMITTALSANGFDISLEDTKNTNPTTENTSRDNAQAVVATFRVTTPNGAPVPGATVTIATDGQRESQNNFVIAVSAMNETSFGEASVGRLSSVAVTADDAGLAKVKVSTATYNQDDCDPVPVRRTGVITASASQTGFATGSAVLTYEVIDGITLASC